MLPDSVIGAIVTSVLFSVYLPTAYPSVPGGDSGELLAEACNLGVAHPPGYPLFIYFARACMEFLPPTLGSPAYRVNLGCCGLGALAGGMLHCAMVSLARRSGRGGPLKDSGAKPPFEWWLLHQVVCASVAILWGLSPLIWLYHIGAEVFALSNFFVVSLLLGGVKFGEAVEGTEPSSSSSSTTITTTIPPGSRVCHLMNCAHALSFLCGLALTNQHTALLLVVPLGAWVAFTLWPILPYPSEGGSSSGSGSVTLALQRMVTLFLAGVAGLLPYLHLPLAHTLWRSAGSWGDTTTLAGLLRHFLRSDYGTFRLLSRDGPAEGPWERTGIYVRDLVTLQLPHVAWGVALVVGVGYAAARGVLYPLSSSLSGEGVKGGGVIKVGDEAVERALAVARHRTRSLSITALLLLPLMFYFAVFHGLSNMPLTDPLLFAVHARFWLHPNALAFPLAALGVLCFHRTLLLLLLPLLSPPTSPTTTTTSNGNAAGDAAAAAAPSPPPSALTLGWRAASLLLTATLGALSVASVALQRTRNTPSLDNSRNTAIGDYGRALLAPLPPNSTLLTAYDFQWTASRYLQSCEGFRRDVAILNAPVMSYPWFSAQRHLYPSLTFPGTHLTPFLTAPHAAGGFSFAELCAVNLGGGGETRKKKKKGEGGGDCGASLLLDSYASDPPHTSFKPRSVVCSPQSGGGGGGGGGGGIFYAGSALGSGGGGGGGASATTEPAFTSTFTSIPFGILTRVLPPKAPITTWRAMHHPPTSTSTSPTTPPPTTPITLAHIQASRAAWATAVTHYYAHGPVNSTQFDDTSWEQATRLDFWSQANAHATWLLEWATSSSSSSPDVTGAGTSTTMAMEVVAEAACLLEATLHAASEHAKPPTSPDPNTLKNLGLAYVHMVRAPSPLLPPPSTGSVVVAPGDAARLPVLPAIRAQAALSSPTTYNASTAAAMVASLSQPPTFCLPPGMVSEELWRLKAAERVLETWGAYLATPQSRSDPGTPQIKSVVQVLQEAAGGKSSGGGGGSGAGATGATPPSTGKASSPKVVGGRKKGK